ncbi:MAG TPA: hypothetical protein VFM18_17930 [Methanosarcina sp.]|nr:hypothetical protein [Methanosarcina sp.]
MIGTCNTNGKGHWSKIAKPVKITHVYLRLMGRKNTANADWGELRAEFDLASWNPKVDGLVYTDPLWLDEFKAFLQLHGYSKKATDAIEYSEQGMQGPNYVSMDVKRNFIVECDTFLNFMHNRQPTLEIKVYELL